MVSQAKVKQDSDVCFFATIMLSHPEVFVSVQCTVPKSWAHRSPTLHAKCSAMCSLSRSNNSSPRLRLKNWCCLASSTFIITLWRRGQNRIGLSVNELLDHFCSFHQWTCQYFKQLWLVFVNVTKPCPGARHNAFFFRGWQLMVTRTLCPVASDDSFLVPPPPWGMTPLWGGKTSFFTSGV